jgi:integrase
MEESEMALYKRGGKWWYEFELRGQRVRETSHSANKEVATRIMRERRRSLELNSGGVQEAAKPFRFLTAAKDYMLDREPHWSVKTRVIHKNSLAHLEPHFGKLLLSEVRPEHINRYQRARLKEEFSPRSINIEIELLRLVMRKHKFWVHIADEARMLKEQKDVGRSLSPDEQHRLLTAAKASSSRSLYPAILASLHTGLRLSELRLLRWYQVDLLAQSVQVGKSKTQGGEGRVVPLSETATRCLREWRSIFPDAKPDHAVFPRESYGLIGKEGTFGGKVAPYQVFPDEPIGSWKGSWGRAKVAAKVECRWHDLRHTFVSRVAESQASDGTIQALAGWMSPKMIERYSHIRNEAKRNAISILDRPQNRMGPHEIPHSDGAGIDAINATN